MGRTSKRKYKQPKETDGIRAFLESYPSLQQRIDCMEERLAFLEAGMDSPSSPNLSGMPGGSRDRTSKQERDYIKAEELRGRLDDLYAEESQRREDIEALIERMDKPQEQTAIEMHYLDGAHWRDVSVALYGNEPDYDEHEQRYLKRTFRVHGSALQSLARIYEGEHGEGDA